MIAAAFEIRILKVTPSFEEAQKELGEIGAKSGYKQYKQNIAERDREYEDIKAQLLKIKKLTGMPYPLHPYRPNNSGL